MGLFAFNRMRLRKVEDAKITTKNAPVAEVKKPVIKATVKNETKKEVKEKEPEVVRGSKRKRK